MELPVGGPGYVDSRHAHECAGKAGERCVELFRWLQTWEPSLPGTACLAASSLLHL